MPMKLQLATHAWSLINTGKDEHGVSWPLVFAPLMITNQPFIFIWSCLLLGFRVKYLGCSLTLRHSRNLSVYLLYLLVKELVSKDKSQKDNFWPLFQLWSWPSLLGISNFLAVAGKSTFPLFIIFRS